VYKTLTIPTQPLCALLAKNDTILLIGGDDKKLLYYQFDDGKTLEPKLKREKNFT